MIETLLFSAHRRSTGFAAGHWVPTLMILPPPCSSKAMLGTVFETICEAAISSLDGCSSTATPLQMSIKHSSSATSADCNDLLQADCPKRAEGLSHLLKLWRQQQRLPERIDDTPRTEADQWLLSI